MDFQAKFNHFKKSIKGAPVAVLGVGISNRPLICFLHKLGAHITAFDGLEANDMVLAKTQEEFLTKGIDLEWSCGQNYLQGLAEKPYKYIFRTPRMRPDLPEIQTAVANGSILTSEMEVFLALCPAPIFGITGSDGKTTTTTLVALMLESQGYKVFLGGNIGTPLLDQIESIQASDKVVVELSSFQLISASLGVDVALITNITPNHLDVHRDYQEYIEAKTHLFEHQDITGRLVLNWDNDITRNLKSKARGEVVFFSKNKPKNLTPELQKLQNYSWVYVENGWIRVVTPELKHTTDQEHIKDQNEEKDGQAEFILAQEEILLLGEHNLENYLAAIAMVWPWVEKEAIRKVALHFGGVEHRIEKIREIDGVTYFNSSIDTSPNRTIQTMKALASRNLKGVLIAGGADKKSDYSQLGEAVLAVCDRIVLCGANAISIKNALQEAAAKGSQPYEVVEVDSYPEALEQARKWAQAGEIIILSPVGTSYDRFRHFEERGNLFKKLVQAL